MFSNVHTLYVLALVILVSVTRTVVSQCTNCGDDGNCIQMKLATLMAMIPQLQNDVEQLQRQLNMSAEQRLQLQQQLANSTEQVLEHMRREHERTRDIHEEMKQQWTAALNDVKEEVARIKNITNVIEGKKTINDLKEAAQPVDGESKTEMRVRILRVMTTLRKIGQSELCSLVAEHIVRNGKLNLDRSVTSENLDDLIYFLSSPAATIIRDLRLANNVVFANNNAALSLAATMTSRKLPQLRRLDLNRCRLTNKGLLAISNAVHTGCHHLISLVCWDRSKDRRLTKASMKTVKTLLTRMPGLSVNLWFRSPLMWMRQLQKEFPGRVD